MDGIQFSFAFVAGSGFILLGRWTYRNPKQMFLRESLARSPGPFLTAFSKTFSTLLIFLGSYLILLTTSRLLLSGYAVQFFSLPAGAVATWVLRPKPAKSICHTDAVSVPASGTGLPLLTTNGKWLLALILGFGLALALTALYLALY